MDLSSFFRRITGSALRVYADFMDPFCFIGFHELRRAAEAARVELEWRGFELNPQTPSEGMPLSAASNSDLHPGMWASVRGYAQKAGLDIPEPLFVPNTNLAHELVLWPATHPVKNPLIEAIYRAYFMHRKNIGDPEILVELASQFGLPPERAKEVLRAGHKRAALETHRQEALKHQFPGMPGFLYRGKIYFGAVASDHWRQIFQGKEQQTCSTK